VRLVRDEGEGDAVGLVDGGNSDDAGSCQVPSVYLDAAYLGVRNSTGQVSSMAVVLVCHYSTASRVTFAIAGRIGKTGCMDAESIVNEFIKRVVSGDLLRAGELVADDLEYDNVPIGKNIGRDAFVTTLGAMTKDVDELVFDTHRQTCTGNVVMNERTDKFRVGDAWIALPVAGVFEVGDDGRITLWRDFFDLKMMTDQMAALSSGT
jgi:limonene-1,2-epoxide hydrolase